MSLGSDIAYSQKGSSTDLPLNGELILFGVRQNIFVIKGGRSTDRQEVRPVDGSVFIRQWNREALTFYVSSASIDKWRHKFRRNRATIEGAERSISNFIEVCSTFERAIELSPTYPDAGFAGASS